MKPQPQAIPFRKRGMAFLLLTFCLLPIHAYVNPIRWEAYVLNFSATFLAFHPSTLVNHVYDVVLIAWVWLIGYGLGQLVLRRLYPQQGVNLHIAIPVGWGILGFLFFILTLLHLLQITILLLTLLLLSFGLALFFYLTKGKDKNLMFRFDSPIKRLSASSMEQKIYYLLVLIPLFYAFTSSLMPPSQSDGLRYHLTVPRLYLEHGGFRLLPDLAFSNFPFLIEYLFMIPMAFGSLSGPKLIHFSYFFLCILLVYQLGKRVGHERSGYFAAILFATTPFVPLFASWSFIECGLTCYTLLGFLLCTDYLDQRERGGSQTPLLVLIGIIGGYTVSCKYTALAVLGLFSLVPITLAVMQRKGWVSGLVSSFLIGGTGMLVASPWFLKNLVLLGNPLYPFAGSLFPTPYWSDFNAMFFSFHAGLKGNLNAVQQMPLLSQVQDFLTLPWFITFFCGDQSFHYPHDFGGWPIGLAWLVLAPFALFQIHWSRRMLAHIVFSFCLFVIWAQTYRDTRFLLPSLAIAAPLFALSYEKMLTAAKNWRPIAFAGFLLIAYGMCLLGYRFYIQTTYAPWWVISGRISEAQYLGDHCDFTRPSYRAFHYLRNNVDPGERVLLHGIDQAFYCPNEFIGSDWFNTDPLIAWAWENATPDLLLGEIKERGIKYVVYNYGTISLYNTAPYFFYRLFRLPPEEGLVLLREIYQQEPIKVRYPYLYQQWMREFPATLARAESRARHIDALETVLQGYGMREVFRYQPPSRNRGKEYTEGVVVYEVIE
jgi:4-amino-4-deoxy-L-arabinose transferase-like glycosyltransferase